MATTTLAAPVLVSNDLLTGAEWSPAHTRELLAITADIKANPANYADTLRGKFIALIFEKPSLRTRVTFEVGIQSMGGHVVFLDHTQARLGERESIADVTVDSKRVAKETKAKIELFTDPREAVEDVQAVYTDAWTSMGFEAEEKVRKEVFKPYQANR